MAESTIQSKGTSQLEKWGWLTVKIIQCNKNGWPDTQAFRNGKTVFIEWKDTGKKVADDGLQAYRHMKLRSNGFEVIVADSLNQISHLK